MKKTLIALAAVAATASFAQSSVQIVGTFDPSLANQKTSYGNGTSVAQNLVRRDSQGTSQITFKGTEDLGGGLKASFLLENDFDPSKDATNNFSSKGGEQFLALEGGFGKVAVGAPNTPTLTAQASRQPIGTKIGGGFSSSGFTGSVYTNGTQGVTGTGHVRSSNSVVYSTPNFAGFTAAVGYVFKSKGDSGAATAIKEAGDVTDIGLNYANGPLRAGLSNWSQAANGTAGGATAYGKNNQTNLYAQYTIAGATLYAGYHQEKTDAVTGGTKVVDSKGYNVAVKYAVTPSVNLLANYGKLDDKLLANLDKQITAVGAQYLLSKNTSLYARYVDEKNDNVGTAATAIKGVKTTLVGMQTNF